MAKESHQVLEQYLLQRAFAENLQMVAEMCGSLASCVQTTDQQTDGIFCWTFGLQDKKIKVLPLLVIVSKRMNFGNIIVNTVEI